MGENALVVKPWSWGLYYESVDLSLKKATKEEWNKWAEKVRHYQESYKMSNFYEDYVIKSHPTGSNYICNPPVTDTDIDTVILAKPGYEQSLVDLGWECNSSDNESYTNNGDFISWRKGNKNYIVTTVPLFYYKFVVATKAAKAVNAKWKPARIALFQAVFNAGLHPNNEGEAPF